MNEVIRDYAKRKHVKLWEVAQGLGVYDSTFSKWMRTEMNPDMRKKVKNIIDDIAQKHEQAETKKR